MVGPMVSRPIVKANELIIGDHQNTMVPQSSYGGGEVWNAVAPILMCKMMLWSCDSYLVNLQVNYTINSSGTDRLFTVKVTLP